MNWRSLRFLAHDTIHPVNIYLLKVNNTNIRTRCEIRSKLTIKTLERPITDLPYIGDMGQMCPIGDMG